MEVWIRAITDEQKNPDYKKVGKNRQMTRMPENKRQEKETQIEALDGTARSESQ